MFPWNLDSGRALDYTYSVRHRYGAPNFHGLTGLRVLPVCIKKDPAAWRGPWVCWLV